MAFYPGYTTTRTDLSVTLLSPEGVPVNPYEISYALYYVDPGPPEVEVLIGDPARVSVNPSVGEHWAAIMVPPNAQEGAYRIRWSFKLYANSPVQRVVQEFQVASSAEATRVVYSGNQRMLMDRLRVLLRDQNPDKFYHFRPPEHSGRVGSFDRVFGQIWEDAELLIYLETALDWFNMHPPSTFGLCSIDKLVNEKPGWRAAILWGAIVHAMFALSANWVADEFSYSIGGISLDIDKSSKYESLKQNAETQFEKAMEAKRTTTFFMRGLKQPAFGIGVRSAFGPHSGRGILGPRAFIVLPLIAVGGRLLSEVLSYAHHLSPLLS